MSTYYQTKIRSLAERGHRKPVHHLLGSSPSAPNLELHNQGLPVRSGGAGIPLLLGTSIQELRRAFPNAPSFQPGGGLSGVQSQSLGGTGQMPGETPLPQTGSNAQGADLGDVPPVPGSVLSQIRGQLRAYQK